MNKFNCVETGRMVRAYENEEKMAQGDHYLEGIFQGFGVNYDEYEDGIGNFTACVVLDAGGRIHLPYAAMCKFVGEA